MNMKEYKDMYIFSMNQVNEYLIDYNNGLWDKEFYSEWNEQIIDIWGELEERKNFHQTDSLIDFLLNEMIERVECKEYIDEEIGGAVANLVCLRYIERGSYIEFDDYECRFVDTTEDKSPNDLLNKLKSLSVKNYRSTF